MFNRLIPLLVVPQMLVVIFGGSAWASEKPLSDAEYYDKVRGAWLGKCIGGALGMPLESWKYWDIEKRYPNITYYVDYFRNEWVSWSGIVQSASVPKDGSWRRVRARIKLPDFDPASVYAVPMIGMSLEWHASPACIEVRNLRVLRPRAEIPFDRTHWKVGSSAHWSDPGVVKFDYKGERAWLRLHTQDAKNLSLKPGDTLLVTFDARWISGGDRIGFGFDYRSLKLRKGFGPDDDTSYQILGLHALETYGPDISCKQIGRESVEHLPKISNQLAEGLALERMRQGIEPPESGEHPIGEAIGAQMKGEIWGLICPGRPDLAAEYGKRDGVVTHFGNGVYGEQFVAVMISMAFREKDVRKLVEGALNHVPQDSKYAQVAREVIAWHDKYPDWRDTRRELLAKYPNICNPVYAEEGIVILALLYGEADFDKSICIAAMCGNDTDCNTATVGAVLGCMKGARAVPAKWKDPVGDEFRSFTREFESWKISELAKRICAAGHKTLYHHRDGVRFTADL